MPSEIKSDWPTLVIAPNYERFRLWCVRNGKNPRNKAYRWINGPEQLYGWGRVNIVELGMPAWWTAEDAVQLAEIKERSR